MNKRILFAGLVGFLSISTLFLLRPPLIKGQENKAVSQEVSVDNFVFKPNTVTVPVNGTITWVNKDDIPHTVVANDGAFKSKVLDTDQRYSFTFSKAGTYTYFCSVHPKMVGTIVVR